MPSEEDHPSVIRAPHGVEFIDRSDHGGSLGRTRLRVNGMESPETLNISYDERAQGTEGVSQSASVNPLYSVQTHSNTLGGSGLRVLSSTPRVVHDLKEEIQTMRDMQRQQEEHRDELLSVLAQERATNDSRNSKTMVLLQKKDAFIEELSDQYDGALERIQELEAALQQENMGRAALEERMGAVLGENDRLGAEIKRLELARESLKQAHRNQMFDMEEKLARNLADLEAEKQAKVEIEANMDDVSQVLDEAEEIMADMQARFEKDKSILENRCNALEMFIGEKLGIDASEHVQYLPSLARKHGEDDSSDSKLVKANRALEDALIKHAIDTKRIGVRLVDGVHDIAVPSFVCDERDIEEDTVESLRSELDQLSKAHELAQQVALHAESELMAALDREAELQQQLKERELVNANENNEEEKWREDALNKLVDLEDTCQELESTLSLKQEEIQRLQSDISEAQKNKERFEEASKKMQEDMSRQYSELHDEIQLLRAELFDARRKLSSREARIASLQAVQKFAIDLSAFESLSLDQIDPSSEPIEFLARSLQEAAQMQTELLESLSELSYVNEHGQDELTSMQKDIDRLRSLVSPADGERSSKITLIDKVRQAQREEMETLRSQLHRSVAIQQGQSLAYSELAEKSRSKEADLKASLIHAQDVLSTNEDFMRNLQTAVAAIKSGLAKIALVEEGDNAAHEILSSYSSPHSILELSIVLADKLTDISQSLSEGSLQISSHSEKKFKELEDRYNSILSAYEAAKMEARHATMALEQFKATLPQQTSPIRSMMKENLSEATSNLVAGDGSNLLNLVNKFEEVLDESARQERKIQELEAKQSQRASTLWNGLVAKKMIREKSREMWIKFRDDIQSLEEANKKYQCDIGSLREQLETAHASLESSIRKQELIRDRYQEEMERNKEIFDERIASLKKEMSDKDEFAAKQLQSSVDTTATQAQEACVLEYKSTIDDMEHEISNLRYQCKRLEEENQTVMEDFKRFQEVKNASIDLLEQRLQTLGIAPKVERRVHRKDALSRIEDVCNSDAAYAALQQAKFEKMERQKIEEEMKKIIHQQSENIPPTSQFIKALNDAETRIDNLDKRLELNASSGGDIERIKAEWHSEAKKVEDDIVRLTLNQPQ